MVLDQDSGLSLDVRSPGFPSYFLSPNIERKEICRGFEVPLLLLQSQLHSLKTPLYRQRRIVSPSSASLF
jgi:hypothetical protein